MYFFICIFEYSLIKIYNMEHTQTNLNEMSTKKENANKVPGTEAKKGATEVKPTKSETQAAKDLAAVNANATVKEITDKKDLKYIYPKDATTLSARKKFRAGARAKIRSYEKKISALQVKAQEAKLSKTEREELTNLTKELEVYEKETLVKMPKVVKGKTIAA